MHGSDFEKRGEDKLKEAVRKCATAKESTKIIVKQMTPHQLRQAYIKVYPACEEQRQVLMLSMQ